MRGFFPVRKSVFVLFVAAIVFGGVLNFAHATVFYDNHSFGTSTIASEPYSSYYNWLGYGPSIAGNTIASTTDLWFGFYNASSSRTPDWDNFAVAPGQITSGNYNGAWVFNSYTITSLSNCLNWNGGSPTSTSYAGWKGLIACEANLLTYAESGFNPAADFNAGDYFYVLDHPDNGSNNPQVAYNSSLSSAVLNGNTGEQHTLFGCITDSSSSNFACMNGDVPGSYYAQIENTSTLHLYSATSTSASVLKTLPADWIIQVVSTTDAFTNPIVNGGYLWYGVKDPTDGTSGWMEASDTIHQYISSYDGGAQADLENSSTLLATKTDRINTLVGALDHYYTNTDTSSSLYSSDDYVDISSVFSSSSPSTTFPESLMLGIAATESGASSTTAGTSNAALSPDYGHGIYQLTVLGWGNDIRYLQVMLNSSVDTEVATGTNPGASGYETHTFGPATENAVERFQAKYGITGDATGTVGTNTRAQLNTMLAGGSYPPIYGSFTFDRNLDEFDHNTEVPIGFDNRGIETGNGATSSNMIPPCGDFENPTSSIYFTNCYTNTTPNHYSTSSAYGQTFEYYDNTPQSIYANVKGAMTLLTDNYKAATSSKDFYDPTTMTTTTFSAAERSWFRDVWRYNGTSTYLLSVASSMIAFSDYRIGSTQLVATSSETVDLVNKLDIAGENYTQIIVFSPVEPRIIDSSGRVTGMVNGEVVEDIPDSIYDPNTKTATILLPSDNFTYQVKGMASGTYGIEIISAHDGKKTVFSDPKVPIKNGVIHNYTLDLAKLARGEKGVTRSISNNGDGTIDKIETLTATTTDIILPDPPSHSVSDNLRPSVNKAQGHLPTRSLPIIPISYPTSSPITSTSTSSSTLNILLSTSTLSIMNTNDSSSVVSAAAASTEISSSTINQ